MANIELQETFAKQKYLIMEMERFILHCRTSYINDKEISYYTADVKVLDEAKDNNIECDRKIELATKLIEFIKEGSVKKEKNDVVEWLFHNGNFRSNIELDFYCNNSKLKDEKIWYRIEKALIILGFCIAVPLIFWLSLKIGVLFIVVGFSISGLIFVVPAGLAIMFLSGKNDELKERRRTIDNLSDDMRSIYMKEALKRRLYLDN